MTNKEYSKNYNMTNKEYLKNYNIKHREKLKEYKRDYYIQNKDKVKKYNKDYYIKNKEKLKQYQKKYNINNKDNHREQQLNRRFGISLEQYNQMFTNQSGNCAICGRNQSEFKRRLAVDHDHNTGKVRALLCRACNLILGNAGDNIDYLKTAIEYLKKHNNMTEV